jgi:hypothetical protein
MKAGHKMFSFSSEIFKDLDQDLHVDNLYMLNGRLTECLREGDMRESSRHVEKISISFRD